MDEYSLPSPIHEKVKTKQKNKIDVNILSLSLPLLIIILRVLRLFLFAARSAWLSFGGGCVWLWFVRFLRAEERVKRRVAVSVTILLTDYIISHNTEHIYLVSSSYCLSSLTRVY